MFRATSLTLAMCLFASTIPVSAAKTTTRQAERTGRISGQAKDAASKPLANHVVRLRDASTGQVVAEARSNSAGQFSFTGLNPGTYIVEVVNDSGQIVGTSSTITLSVGAMVVTGLVLTGSAAAAGAVAGASAAAAGGFFSTHAVIVLAAAAAGIGGAVAVAKANASPSR